MTQKKIKITVEADVNAPLGTVWRSWTSPESIMRWNSPAPDWHCPKAVNDLRSGGTFNYRMEAKDGSVGFDFAGQYNRVIPDQLIEYTIADGREVQVTFSGGGRDTKVTSVFEAETENTLEFQQAGWQAILDNFKTYVEHGQ